MNFFLALIQAISTNIQNAFSVKIRAIEINCVLGLDEWITLFGGASQVSRLPPYKCIRNDRNNVDKLLFHLPFSIWFFRLFLNTNQESLKNHQRPGLIIFLQLNLPKNNWLQNFGKPEKICPRRNFYYCTLFVIRFGFGFPLLFQCCPIHFCGEQQIIFV